MTAVSTPEYGHHYGQQFGQQGPPQNPHHAPGAPAGAPQVPGTPGPYGYPDPGQQQASFAHTAPVPQPGYVTPGPPEGGRRKRGLIVGLVIALVLAVGGGATWWVLSERESVASGASTPEDAATRLLTALGDGDLLGAANSLAPGEAAVLGDQLQEAFTEFTRLGVLSEDADASAFSGISFTAENLTFDTAAAEQVNDRVTIAKLTGGTFTLDADLDQLPLSPEYRDAFIAAATEDSGQTAARETVDIATLVKQSGSPIRIATVNVDGGWHPSLLYTLVDNALAEEGMSWPSSSIPARGADSPDEAVRDIVQAALNADLNRVIELLPPDEMAVAHDVGPLLVRTLAAQGARRSGVQLLDLQTEDTPVTGGTLATITKLELAAPNGSTLSVSKDGDCYDVGFSGRSERLCGADLAAMLAQNAEMDASPEVLERLTRVLADQGIGMITTEVDGKHYVSPLRTLGDLGMRMYRELSPEEFRAMLEFD